MNPNLLAFNAFNQSLGSVSNGGILFLTLNELYKRYGIEYEEKYFREKLEKLLAPLGDLSLRSLPGLGSGNARMIEGVLRNLQQLYKRSDRLSQQRDEFVEGNGNLIAGAYLVSAGLLVFIWLSQGGDFSSIIQAIMKTVGILVIGFALAYMMFMYEGRSFQSITPNDMFEMAVQSLMNYQNNNANSSL